MYGVNVLNPANRFSGISVRPEHPSKVLRNMASVVVAIPRNKFSGISVRFEHPINASLKLGLRPLSIVGNILPKLPDRRAIFLFSQNLTTGSHEFSEYAVAKPVNLIVYSPAVAYSCQFHVLSAHSLLTVCTVPSPQSIVKLPRARKSNPNVCVSGVVWIINWFSCLISVRTAWIVAVVSTATRVANSPLP